MEKLLDFKTAIDNHKKSIRVKDAKILRDINSWIIYKRTIPAVRNMMLGSSNFTAARGDLGKKILEGYEDLTQSEKIIRKRRQSVGGEVYRIFFNHNVFELKRDIDDAKVERERDKKKLLIDPYYEKPQNKSKAYQIKPIRIEKVINQRYKVKGKIINKEVTVKVENPFVDALFNTHFISSDGYNGPQLGDNTTREGFNDMGQGELVHSINYANINEFSIENAPLLYEIAGKQDVIPFRINKKVLDIVLARQDIDLFTMNHLKVDTEGLSPKHAKYKKWKLKETKTGRKRENNLVLDEAKFLGDKLFRCKHYFDFRTRLYCSTNYLNYAGSKLAKSMFYFVNAKPLGVKGWNYLLMSTANCWGNEDVDKLPVNARMDWTEDNLDWILDVANDAKNDLRWTEADDPFNFLAHILEIAAAINSGDEYNYISGLPIHLDATCSGLQVLSALSLDKVSGKLCNLTDCDVRGDYYLYIADYVWKQLEEMDTPEARFWVSMYNKRRKIAKRSGMTFFYSCGAGTMGEHIYEDFEWEAGFGKLTMKHTSMLGRLIYNACVKLMPGPSYLMNLFVAIGRLEAEMGRDLSVTGPVNKAKMIQNYRNDVSSKMDYIYKGKKLQLRYYSERGSVVRKGKVKTSSSPNIVHFLDAQIVAALLLSTDYNIITIHDSFASVAADADKLYNDTRRVFVEIFDTNLLEELVEPFRDDARIIADKAEDSIIRLKKKDVTFLTKKDKDNIRDDIRYNKNLRDQCNMITGDLKYGDLNVREVYKNQYFTS